MDVGAHLTEMTRGLTLPKLLPFHHAGLVCAAVRCSDIWEAANPKSWDVVEEVQHFHVRELLEERSKEQGASLHSPKI
jgi:hypothetical protein